MELGDARRTQRLLQLVEELSAQPPGSLPLASGGWGETKAAYRLLDHPTVAWRERLAVHPQRTGERMQGPPGGLCIQDPTELDVPSHPGIAGLGRVSYEAQHGLYPHAPRGVTPAGVALGVLDAGRWARGPQAAPPGKESPRWREGYEIGADLAAPPPDTRLVYLADREGDLREGMAAAARRGSPADWLGRAKHNRLPTPAGAKLWDRRAQSDPLGAVEFLLPAAPDRPARGGRQPLSRARVTLPAPRGAPALAVPALLPREAPPPTGAKAIEWRGLSNRVAETLEQAVELIDWDRRRWRVDIFFRLWKSGGRVEALQLGPRERLERALVLYLSIAWRIRPLVTWGRACPNLPGDVGFDLEAWPAAWLVAPRRSPPATPAKLGEMVRLIAGFGGLLGRKSAGHPGPNAIWDGRQRVRECALALEAGKAVEAGSG